MKKKNKLLQIIQLSLLKQYASIGGQAVIEGVMMRSPNSFVVAVRKADGKIRLRTAPWYGLSSRFNIFKKPFLRGILVLIETMLNGVVSLNYSANIAAEGEQEAKAKAKESKEEEKPKKASEKVDFTTFFSIGLSIIFGYALFVFAPHAITAYTIKFLSLDWSLNSFEFHLFDGTVKASIFLFYIFLIGLLPDVRRVFQYHGAEHKSISTFENGKSLDVQNALEYPTFHPRCGTTFVFFLIFISIIFYSVLFTLIPIGQGMSFVPKHLSAIGFKLLCTPIIAGISYELIKLMGTRSNTFYGKLISYPGMLLQRLTTKEPDQEQLEVGLASIKAALYFEQKYTKHQANDQGEKTVKLAEVDIDQLDDIQESNYKLKDFLEA